MARGIDQFQAKVVEAARRDPANAPRIFSRAASTLIGLSRNPKNSRAAAQLQAVAREFQNAAAPMVAVEDFEDLLEEVADSYEEDGDPVDQIARERVLHDERERGATRVSIAPVSFNRDATLGRSLIITYAPTQEQIKSGVVESQTVVLWQGEKNEAQALTVDIAPISPGPAAQDGVFLNVRPYAIVEYGSDGNKTSVKLDVGTGVRLTVVGNYCSVLIGMDAPPPDNGSIPLSVGASIGTFAAPSQAPILLTKYIDALGEDQTSSWIPRPMRAVMMLPPQTTALTGNILLLFLDQGLVFRYRLMVPVGSINMSPIPLADDISFIGLANLTHDLPSEDFRLMFQLSL